MDVQQQQLASAEQEVVLRGLALSAARPRCKFLEVGSWCGHSTIILAKVAQKFGGHLFCVDWWKGNPGTELADIAAQEDIFTLFWQRICAEGLQDVVVPMRGPSALLAQILRADSFQMVFLDADHSYRRVKQDIRMYAPLVSRRAGILCGHDCEGRISDYDPAFLEIGKNLDYHETVHCGVVSAVGEAFPRCSINHSIWSVRAAKSWSGWEPTELIFPGIADKRQAPPPPIGATRTHNLLRYGRRVYAVPHSWADFDVTDAEHRDHPEIKSARTEEKAAELAQIEAPPTTTPFLVEEGYLGFNIVAYGGVYYALSQGIGPFDFTKLNRAKIVELTRQAKLFCAKSHRVARLNVARCVLGCRDLQAPQDEWMSHEPSDRLLESPCLRA